jgi:hypothetical protein
LEIILHPGVSQITVKSEKHKIAYEKINLQSCAIDIFKNEILFLSTRHQHVIFRIGVYLMLRQPMKSSQEIYSAVNKIFKMKNRTIIRNSSTR